jgi:hypothetical protein
MSKLVRKLTSLKKKVILWEINKKKGLQMELEEILDEIKTIFIGNFEGVFSNRELERLNVLRSRKAKILKIYEETWWLKSRVVWLQKGDNNTICFHCYVDYQRKHNAIWDILTDDGCWVNSSKDFHLKLSNISLVFLMTL